MNKINYDQIITQLSAELNSQCAVSNKYGIILASTIEELAKGKIIPQKILELISSKKELAKELNLNDINSFAFEAQENNYVFTFSKELILISKIDLEVNLAAFMPSITAFLEKLSAGSIDEGIEEFSKFEFEKEIKKIEDALQEEDLKKEKFSIIKDIIKIISK